MAGTAGRIGPLAAHHHRMSRCCGDVALWRLLAGLAIIAVIHVGLAGIGTWLLLRPAGPPGEPGGVERLAADGGTPAGLLLQLAVIGLLGPATLLANRLLRQCPARCLFGPLPEIWRAFLRVTLATGAALALLGAVIHAALPMPLAPGLPAGEWLRWLLPALIAILAQTGAEELLFRGYLQGHLAARFRSPWLWLGLPSAAFGLLHLAPEAGANNLCLVAWALIFGLLAGDLTARSGNVGAAVGLHFVNNVSAMLYMAIRGHADGLALFRLDLPISDRTLLPQLLALDLAVTIWLWLVARRVLARRPGRRSGGTAR